MDNHSPAVMFEILANDQAKLLSFYETIFGWKEIPGTDNFAYIRFPAAYRPLLGGIGQAKPGVPGWGKGITFYLHVRKIDEALFEKIHAKGGAVIELALGEKILTVDGYTFAMFKDPESNLIGLVESFPEESEPESIG